MRLNWKVTVFSVVAFALFVNLGLWQTERAAEKVDLMAREALRRSAPPASLAEVTAPVDGARVRLTGRFDPEHVFLLDNRILEGRVGFEVLVPFRDEISDRWVLVNRGFVQMGRTRRDVPDIPPVPGGEVSITGSIYVLKERPPGDVPLTAELASGMTILQFPAPSLVEETAGLDLYEHVVRLTADAPAALPRHWPVTVMSPARHRGYAIQWFFMAGAVLVAWTLFTFRRRQVGGADTSDDDNGNDDGKDGRDQGGQRG